MSEKEYLEWKPERIQLKQLKDGSWLDERTGRIETDEKLKEWHAKLESSNQLLQDLDASQADQ